jgi:hypothetical protein
MCNAAVTYASSASTDVATYEDLQGHHLVAIKNLIATTNDESYHGSASELLSYGPPWAHCLGGYQDRLLGGPLELPDLRYTAPEGVEHKDSTGVVLG